MTKVTSIRIFITNFDVLGPDIYVIPTQGQKMNVYFHHKINIGLNHASESRFVL